MHGGKRNIPYGFGVDFILISTRSINKAFNVERAKILPRVLLPNWILVRGKICSNFQRRRMSLYSTRGKIQSSYAL